MILCLNREAYNQGYDATFAFEISEELSPPLMARGPTAMLVPLEEEEEDE